MLRQDLLNLNYIHRYVVVHDLGHIYRGYLKEVGDKFLILSDVHIVNTNGEDFVDASRPSEEEPIPSDLLINLSSIENVCVPAWASFGAKISEGEQYKEGKEKTLGEELEELGWMNHYIAVSSTSWIYRGYLKEVGDEFLILKDAHAVEEISSVNTKSPDFETSIPSDLLLSSITIENICIPTWASFEAKIKEGGYISVESGSGKKLKRGLEDLGWINRYVAVWSFNWVYRGYLEKVGDEFLILKDAHAVEITGDVNTKAPTAETSIPSDLLITLNSIENICIPTWASFDAKIREGGYNSTGDGNEELTQGLRDLGWINHYVAIWTSGWVYRGYLEKAEDEFLILKDAHAVESTGNANIQSPIAETSIPSDLLITSSSIENICIPTWASFGAKISEGGSNLLPKGDKKTLEQGLKDLGWIKRYISIWATDWVYRGYLEKVAYGFLVLKDVHVVEETGPVDTKTPLKEKPIKDDMFFSVSYIENICIPTWASFNAKIKEGECNIEGDIREAQCFEDLGLVDRQILVLGYDFVYVGNLEKVEEESLLLKDAYSKPLNEAKDFISPTKMVPVSCDLLINLHSIRGIFTPHFKLLHFIPKKVKSN